MEKITISTGHPDAGRVYAEAYDAALEREAALLEEIEMAKQVQETTDAIVTMVDGQRDHWIEKCGLLKQRLTVAERRESEAREELLDLSRKLDVFYSRSHGIKNLSAIEDANDKSKALQQRLTVAEKRIVVLTEALEGMIEYFPEGHSDGECFSVERANLSLGRSNDCIHDWFPDYCLKCGITKP